MNTRVRQGCLLSPLLFLVALDWVSQQAFGDNKAGIQFTLFQKLEDLDFADDKIYGFAESEDHPHETEVRDAGRRGGQGRSQN